MIQFECSIYKEKSFDVIKKYLRHKLGLMLGSHFHSLVSSSKKHASIDSSRKSKGSTDMSSIKKLHLGGMKDSTPTSKFTVDKDGGYLRFDDGGHKSNGFNISRDKDETMDYRLKSDAVNRQDLFAFDEEAEDLETKRINGIKDTPRLINFSMNSIERSASKDNFQIQEPSIDKWMLAGGLKSSTDNISSQETKRTTPLHLSYERKLESNMFRELPPQPSTQVSKQDQTEDYRFINTGVTHFLAGGDCVSTPRIRDPLGDNDRLKEIDKEIDNLEKSMDRISKTPTPYEFKEELPYNSRITPIKQPSPPLKNIFNQNVFAVQPTKLEDRYSKDSREASFDVHLPVFSTMVSNQGKSEASGFHTFKSSMAQEQSNYDLNGKVLMRLEINNVELEVFKHDTSDKLARKYFSLIGVSPMKKDLQRLKALICEQVNKKIDYLEKLFRRTVSSKENTNAFNSRTSSIDISNKENKHPNILANQLPKMIKPPLMDRKNSMASQQTSQWKSTSRSKFDSNSSFLDNQRSGYAAELSKRRLDSSSSMISKNSKNSSRPKSPTTSMTYNTKANKSVDISVKKDDDPKELARIILLQRGLGLAGVDKLAENIRQFQIRTYGVKKGPIAS